MDSNNVDDESMPKVGTLVTHQSKRKFEVTRIIACGPFSTVYQVIDPANGEMFAMKVENELRNIRPSLVLDVYVLTRIGMRAGFPHLIATGRSATYKYAVMQLVGVDLGRLRRAMPEKKFSLGTALRVCKQTLERIETLHEAGFLYRDVKANNFAIGREDPNTVYMLDFGFVRHYVDKYGNLMSPRPATALLGTIHYASLAAHKLKEQCRRDDLESWLYMCVELCSGPLPWSHLEPLINHMVIAKWKQHIRTTARHGFFIGCPTEMSEMLTRIDALDFYQRPPYEDLHKILDSMIERDGISSIDPLDWQFVGEIGESHLASVRLREQQEILENKIDDDLRTPPIHISDG
ncbi:Protein kinase domain-containing protein [Aphelenchoides besseyi]|nr:Protein kinase domain-containing protein [Aphelenchoides besseyi]